MSDIIVHPPGGGPIEYTAAYPGVRIPTRGPMPIDQRRPSRNGDPVAPVVARLNGLPPRTVGDWSGLISGVATVYNVRLNDHLGRPELFTPTTFAKDHGVEVPVLLNHDYERHVGWATLEHRRDGVYFTGQLNRTGAQRVGDWRGLSIGFGSVSLTPTGGTTRRHYTGQIYELSIVPRGAHHPHSFVKLITDDIALAA